MKRISPFLPSKGDRDRREPNISKQLQAQLKVTTQKLISSHNKDHTADPRLQDVAKGHWIPQATAPQMPQGTG